MDVARARALAHIHTHTHTATVTFADQIKHLSRDWSCFGAQSLVGTTAGWKHRFWPVNREGRTCGESALALKYSRSSSAGAARVWVVPADPGFCVSTEPGLAHSGSNASPRASRPLRARSPPWFPAPPPVCPRAAACLRSGCLLCPHEEQRCHPRPRAISPRLALTLCDLHLEPCAAQHATLLHPTGKRALLLCAARAVRVCARARSLAHRCRDQH